MNKIIIYSIVLASFLLCAVVGAGIYFFLRNQNTATDQEPIETEQPSGPISQTPNPGGQSPNVPILPDPEPSETETPASPPLTIRGEDGEPIVVNNFKELSTTEEDPNNPDQYFLTGITEDTTELYSILFVDADQSFTIALLQEPLKNTREEAEQSLMKILGIPPQDMCRLPYTVLVPYSVSPIYAGKNVGFSFCTGAMPL